MSSGNIGHVSNGARRDRGGTPFVEPLEDRQLFAVPSGFALSTYATGLTRPVAMAVAPDGRVFVCEQGGALRVIDVNEQLLASPFASVTTRPDGEQGLLGVAFAPDFATSRNLYIHYITSTSQNRIMRFTADGSNPNVAAGAGTEILTLPQDPNFGYNHQGGALGFGADGKLYLTVGEHNTPSYAQTLTSPFGKVLRLNPDGSFPSDNPFYASSTGWGRAVWALGLRNPFTFAFQPGTGRLFVNDVGGGLREEVNEGAAGANFGWPATEGKFNASTYPQFTNPLHDYERGIVGDAITGGSFYSPGAGATRPWPASYHGTYLYSDYGRTFLKVLGPSDNFAAATTFATELPARPVDVDVAPLTGDVLVLSRGGEGTGNGSVIRIAYTASDAPSIGTQPQNRTVPVGEPATFSVSASGAATLGYQWQRDGTNIAGATSSSYTLSATQLSDSGAQFRCVVTNSLGTATSNAATLTVTTNQAPTATITTPSGGATYRAGDTIAFGGTGTDGEDGTLGAAAFMWRVDFHHADHTHPAMAPTSGVTGGSFPIPTNNETAADVFYRIHLTVTDSAGLTHSTFRDVTPVTADVTLATNVAGLQLTLDGAAFTAPATFTGVAGITRSIAAPPTQAVGGVTYAFASWSDGGAATHALSTPDANATLTAVYQAQANPDPGPGPGPEPEPDPEPNNPDPPVDPGTGTGGDLTALLSGKFPALAINGTSGKVTVRVNNTGDAPIADLVTVSLFLSPDAVFDVTDAAAGSITRPLKLNPGKGKAVPLTFTYPSVADGNYFLLAQVDPANAIGEAFELNNVSASAAPVPVQAPVINLTGTLSGPTTPVVARGGRAPAVLSLTNGGNVMAKGPVTLSLFAATDAAGQTNAAPVLTQTKTLKLKPGASKAFRLKLVLPVDLPPGAYFLAAAIDPDNRFAEPNEADNTVVAATGFQAT
jgi:glucose/arabinose dehydrogenase